MSTAPAHNRRHTRRPFQLEARLRVGGRRLSATTENISPGGAFLAVALPPDTRELLALIKLPHGKSLRVRAQVRWLRSSPPGVGVSFEQFIENGEHLFA